MSVKLATGMTTINLAKEFSKIYYHHDSKIIYCMIVGMVDS